MAPGASPWRRVPFCSRLAFNVKALKVATMALRFSVDRIEAIVGTSVEEERMEEIGAFFGQIEEIHPHEEHWYLPMIAADPSKTGRGLRNRVDEARAGPCR